MMDRHRTDYVELLFGLMFMASGAGFIVHQTTDRTFDAAWIAAIALVTIGCAFLAVTLFNRPRPEPVTAGPVGTGQPPDNGDDDQRREAHAGTFVESVEDGGADTVVPAPFGDAPGPGDGSGDDREW